MHGNRLIGQFAPISVVLNAPIYRKSSSLEPHFDSDIRLVT